MRASLNANATPTAFNRSRLRTLLLIILLLLIAAPTAAFADHTRHRDRGFISKRSCPHSCRSMGISKRFCRDWREGHLCVVEDLRNTRNPIRPIQRPVRPGGWTGHNPGYHPHRPVRPVRTCATISRHEVPAPRVEITRIRPSGFFSSKVKVYGVVEGRCLQSAGGYEDGRQVDRFSIPTTLEYGRYEFSTRLDRRDIPDIRVYNTLGDSDIRTVGNSYRPIADRPFNRPRLPGRPNHDWGYLPPRYDNGYVAPCDR